LTGENQVFEGAKEGVERNRGRVLLDERGPTIRLWHAPDMERRNLTQFGDAEITRGVVGRRGQRSQTQRFLGAKCDSASASEG